ncbi:MAG: hypothetical protein IH624_10400 [Phycisphaerae bacterium]|nr:hypothetical protein [Phycisphaerae bacterium]
MAQSRRKTLVSITLVLLGVGLLAYGVAFHVINVHPKEDGAAAIETREPDAVRQASVGGLERDESGSVKQTYTGESPKACAT